jgi:hypothetical protein
MKTKVLNELENLQKKVKSNGISIGKKETNGKKTSEVAVCFYVDEKKKISEIPQDEVVPNSVIIDGKTYNTDVKVKPTIDALICYNPSSSEITRLQGTPNLLTPIMGGQEISEFPTNWSFDGSNFNFFVGTLGFLAVDNIDDKVVGVTNTHVAVNNLYIASSRNIADAGEPYNTIEEREWDLLDFGFAQNGQSYPPGTACRDGNSLVHSARYLKRHAPFRPLGPNFVDCCLLVMEPSVISNQSYMIHQPTTEPPYTAHLPFASTAEIDALTLAGGIPTAVYSTGRTTGPKGWGASPSCQLEITAVPANVNVNFNGDLVPFTDVIEYEFVDGSAFPAAPGDSGSALIAEIGGVRKIIGVVFAGGSNPLTNTGTAYAIRIDRIASELNIREWDSNYNFDASVPTPTVVSLPLSDARADSVSLTDSNLDTVYQAGLSNSTGIDEFS